MVSVMATLFIQREAEQAEPLVVGAWNAETMLRVIATAFGVEPQKDEVKVVGADETDLFTVRFFVE